MECTRQKQHVKQRSLNSSIWVLCKVRSRHALILTHCSITLLTFPISQTKTRDCLGQSFPPVLLDTRQRCCYRQHAQSHVIEAKAMCAAAQACCATMTSRRHLCLWCTDHVVHVIFACCPWQTWQLKLSVAVPGNQEWAE